MAKLAHRFAANGVLMLSKWIFTALSLTQTPKKTLFVRSAYRNDPEFQVQNLQRVGDPLDEVRVQRMIDNDGAVLTALVEWVGKPGELVELLAEKQSIRVARPGVPPDDLKPAIGEIYLACKQLLGLTQLGNDAKTFMRDTLAPLITLGTMAYDELKRDIFGSDGGYASK